MSSPFRAEYSIQQLLNMDNGDPFVQKCIHQLKSPLQMFQYDPNASASTIDYARLDNQPQKVKKFQLTEQEFLDSQKKRESRKRKSIFENTKNYSLHNNRKQMPPQQKKNDNYIFLQQNNSPQTPKRSNVYRKQIFAPKYESRLIIPQKSITYNNKRVVNQELKDKIQNLDNLNQYEKEFIEFLLKILSKLHLKKSITNKILAEKAEILQALLSTVQNQHKHQLLQILFNKEGLKRIDRRFNSINVNEFLVELTETAHRPMKQFNRQNILLKIEQILQILGEVEDLIRSYLSNKHRVEELEYIYNKINKNQNKSLLESLQSYLSSHQISLSLKYLSLLGYVWRQIDRRSYSKSQFIEQLCKNDLIIRETNKVMEDKLSKLGFVRND